MALTPIRLLAAAISALPAVLALGQTARAGDLGAYPEPRTYEQEYGDRGGGSIKDGPPPPPRYSEYRETRPACVPRHVIRDRLVGEGWRDFHDPVLRGPVGVVLARRPSGDLYELRIDRCSGEIVNAHRVVREVEPAYAYEPRYYAPRYAGPYFYYGPRWAYGRHGWGHHRYR